MENMMFPGMDKMADFNKQWMDSFAEMNELAIEAQRKLAEQGKSAFEANFGAAQKIMDAMIAGKKPAELYALQVETGQALGEDMLNMARQAWETQVETRDKMIALLSEKAEAATLATPASKPAAKKAA